MNPDSRNIHWQDYDPEWLARHYLLVQQRVLLVGEPGSGKSTLARTLAQALAQRDKSCLCLSADPGSPAFGPPGAVSLAEWQDDHWQIMATEALCSLDAARFRMPLSLAVAHLVKHLDYRPLIIDAPGLVRGVAGAELLQALLVASGARAVVLLGRLASLPLTNELASLPCPVVTMNSPTGAKRLSRLERRQFRTQSWDRHLQPAGTVTLDCSQWLITGTPPPLHARSAWRGRQIAVLRKQKTVALGEVVDLVDGQLEVRIAGSSPGDTLLVRNAVRRSDGMLATARKRTAPGKDPEAGGEVRVAHPPDDAVHFRLGPLSARLVNGVFGDPMIDLRLNERRRRLLFDLGDPGRLPARLAHQVSDVFISHAHFDHIGGFPWLLRARILPLPACHLYGPPGLAAHVAHWVGGVHWDRVAEQAPEFIVHELHSAPTGAARLERYHIRAGAPSQSMEPLPVDKDVLLSNGHLKVRARVLDHGIPVLAFALETPDRFNVDRERLAARNLAGGHWLSRLKQAAWDKDLEALIELPDQTRERAGDLMDQLLQRTPGERLVYATDLADTPQNRESLIDLARGASVFVCEAPFIDRDAEQARNTGHLTARACGEIAAAARVKQLIPFHFSRRYSGDPAVVYREVEEGFGDIVFGRN
ncbi:Clp1/GlmU family protein [Marinobacteraceae bacterium S3BR75-40.1]